MAAPVSFIRLLAGALSADFRRTDLFEHDTRDAVFHGHLHDLLRDNQSAASASMVSGRGSLGLQNPKEVPRAIVSIGI
jgi:hypothetical protein